MKNLITAFILCTIFLSCGNKSEYVTIKTPYGNMVAELYNSTPKHKENFLKLVDENFYDSLLWHRVISQFMIQGGDPNSRNAGPSARLGTGGPGYGIDAEIGAPHIKGALAAARTGDAGNPERKSSGSQFYIVQGAEVSDQLLDQAEQRLQIKYNDTQRALYKEKGGYPMLDGQYTVFGEVVEGLEVIDKIAAVKKQPGDRPVEDVWMVIERK